MSSPAVLITIPLSHYCEKARWGLDRVALPYREQPHAPLLHLLATKRNDGGTVPVLVQGTARFVDSTAILVHADSIGGGDLLYPRDAALRSEVDALEERFDTELGPHARRWVYSHLLADAKLLRSVWSRGIPRFEASMVPAIAPLARYLARKAYKITPESAQRSLERVRGVFREVDERLGDARRFLVGNRFTAADLTFAALAAPMLFPPECRATHPTLDAVPAAMREEVSRLRDTGAGRFALRMFAQERGTQEPRSARDSEVDALARLWYAGWQDTHAAILPAELAKLRTLESFRDRLRANIGNVRVAGSSDQPLGLCMLKADELYQLYVAPAARGSGIAAVLLKDGEEWLRSHGVQTAWLACAIGNNRAARFYEKNGWNRVGDMLLQVETTDGDFPLEVWRYEKDL